MTTLQSLLVGAHFCPPAKQLLTALPAGTPLLLIPEPDNPYDENAVRVLLPLSSLPSTEDPLSGGLDHALLGTGLSLDDLLAAGEPIHLGYLPATGNKQLAQAQAQGLSLASNIEVLQALAAQPPWHALLRFAPDGSPMVAALPDTKEPKVPPHG